MVESFPIHVEHVSKQYGRLQALKDASLTLHEGEIFGLIGLNGAGKTTLLKILLNLIRPDAGTAMLFGLPASHKRARRHLSYLPEKFQPSRYLTGWEFLRLSAAYFGQNLDRERTEQLVMALDLNVDALSKRVGTYSKGMGQKLGLASTLAVDTRLLLLDEPMSGLDPRARARLKDTLLAAKAAGKTIFFSSHILSDIEELCDRIAIMHEGVLHPETTPAAFKNAYYDASLERSFLKFLEIKTATDANGLSSPSQAA